ncbi:MAG: cell division FtsZ family protein, partial [Alistipes sp.]|nr:cell division FtsZ family protein [Alistipes sp.]
MSLYSIFQQNKPDVQSIAARIMVIGVGGAGGNSVDYIWTMGIKGVNLLICNTDIKALDKSPLQPHQKICMGDGKGAGNDAQVGAEKAKESLDEIREYILTNKPDMIFLTAGMGGGTGTGATPVIAKMIHQLDIPTIAILTTPSKNEGTHRYKQAKAGIDAMADAVDTFIFLRNETIIELYKHLPVHAAFNKGNDVVALAAKGIADIALTQSDLVSVDISDVCKVVRKSRCAVMGMACAVGENRVEEAINMAILSPLFGGTSIEGAQAVLINFATSSPDKLIMSDVNDALNYIQKLTRPQKGKYEDDTSIIWGTSIKPELDDQLEIIIVVSG